MSEPESSQHWACSSVGAIRKRAVLTASLVVLFVLALMSGPLRYTLAIPGPLASFHASLAEDCVQCHSLAADAIASAWDGHTVSELKLQQSQKCLGCHSIGTTPMRPHAWSPEAEELVRAHSSTTAPAATLSHEFIACATCHHDHRGRLADLTAMASARCQSCHAQSFEGFEQAHPAFANFPSPRTSGIRFDHRAHIQRHFEADPELTAPTACTDCHVPDADGARMTLRPFEQTCASCHSGDIRGSSQIDGKGLTVLSIPALDVWSFEPLGIGVGRWPADADYSETPLGPFLSLFLSHSDLSERDLELASSVDLLDLSEASEQEVISVARTALRIKGLLRDLLPGGHAALHQRLEAVVGQKLATHETAPLLGQVPSEVIRQALDLWLPGLVDDHACEETVLVQTVASETDSDPIDFELDEDQQREAWMESGGWYRQDLDCSIRYRPVGHADPFLQAWIEWSGSRSDSTVAAQLYETLTDPDAVGRCGKCHVAPAHSWSAQPAVLAEQRVTNFTHSVHFPVLGERGCLTCHELEPVSAEPTAPLASSFGPIRVESCQTCHTSERASDRCLTCHDYHAVRPVMELPSAPFSLAKDQAEDDSR